MGLVGHQNVVLLKLALLEEDGKLVFLVEVRDFVFQFFDMRGGGFQLIHFQSNHLKVLVFPHRRLDEHLMELGVLLEVFVQIQQVQVISSQLRFEVEGLQLENIGKDGFGNQVLVSEIDVIFPKTSLALKKLVVEGVDVVDHDGQLVQLSIRGCLQQNVCIQDQDVGRLAQKLLQLCVHGNNLAKVFDQHKVVV